MNSLHILLLCVGFYNSLAAPTSDTKSMYHAIEENCSAVNDIPNYKELPLFNICKDWKTISEVSNFTEKNANDVRCLLYYYSFTQYCNGSKKLDETLPPQEQLSKYKLDVICNYAKNISHANLSRIFSNNDNCKKICMDPMGLPDSFCSTSYHFANSMSEKINRQSKVLSSSNIRVLKGEHKKSDSVVAARTLNGPQKIDNGSAPALQLTVSTSLPQNGYSGVSQDADSAQRNSLVLSSIKESEPKLKTLHEQTETSTPVQSNQQPHVPLVQPIGRQEGAGEMISLNKNQASQDKGVDKVEKSGVQPQIVDNHANLASLITQNAAGVEQKTESDSNKKKTVDEIDPNQAKNEQNQQEIPIETNQQIDELDDDDGQQPYMPDDDIPDSNLNSVRNEKSSKPISIEASEPVNYTTEMDGDSYFFTYFMILCIMFIVGYVCYHNKQKILALILEGRRGKRQYRGRRPNSANYHKLNSNLEEAISSSCKKNTNNVIY